MAGAKGPTTSIRTKLYHAAPLTEAATYALVDALAIPANEVEHTREIGDIAQEANIFEYVEFGKSTQTRVAGPASLGDFVFTFTVDFQNDKHQALVDANPGDPAAIVMATVTKVDAEETYFYMQGTIASSSILSPSGDVKQCSVGIAFEQKPLRFDQA